MNRIQKNTQEVYNTIVAHWESAPEIWESNALIKVQVNGFKLAVGNINNESYRQEERNAKGWTKAKEAHLDHLCTLAFAMVTRVRPFARINKNLILLQAVDYSFTDLRRPKSGTTINRCQIIHDRCKELLTELAPFKVTEAGLTELQKAIDDYTPMVNQRNIEEDERTTVTQSIPALFAEAREYLANLDDLVLSQLEDESFIATYFQAKKIRARATRKKTESTPPASPTV
jgi:hypothetical protein